MILVEVKGDEELNQLLDEMKFRLQNFMPAFHQIQESFFHMQEVQFETEGAFTGGWQPLSEAYAVWKNRHVPGAKILELSGALRKSLTERTKDSVTAITPRIAKFGTQIPYAQVHQQGKGIPRREIIVVPEEQKKAWMLIVANYLMGRLRK